MRHVAALAGVGVKTVSRVMNGEPNVSKETVDRVRDAVSRLNYELDVNAGNLKRANGRTMTLGLLVGSVANPFAGAIHRAIEQAAWERDIAVFASSLDDDPRREQAIISAFLRRRVDGLILTTVSESQTYIAPAQARGTRLVFIDREPVGIAADAIITDNAAASARATAHLLAHGHRRLAYFGDRSDIQTARERLRGFSEEIGRAGLALADMSIVQDLTDPDLARAAVGAALAADDAPTAVYSSQNLVTIGAVRAIRENGTRDVTALVGFDDFPLADLVEPAVTVLAQDPAAMGRLAAERMFARLDGDTTPPRNHIVPTVLIERGSGEIPNPR